MANTTYIFFVSCLYFLHALNLSISFVNSPMMMATVVAMALQDCGLKKYAFLDTYFMFDNGYIINERGRYYINSYTKIL